MSDDILKLDVETYIKALENEFYLDVHFSKIRRLKVNFFRSELFSGYVISSLKSVAYIFAMPIFLFFNRLSIPENIGEHAYFVCSNKSNRMFSSYESTDKFGFFGGGLKFDFKLKDTYYFFILAFAFIKRFKFSFWFYPEMILIPEMIKINRFLEESNVKHLHITNQYDRWAYFLSSLKLDCTVNLEQHGIVSRDYKPKNKIKVLNCLTCYDLQQFDIFSSYIVNSIANVNIVPPSISLYPDLGKCSVLLCGTSNKKFTSVERKLYDVMKKSKGINLAVKPHPNNVTSYSKLENVFVGDVYPKASVVIHFNSTLEIEYKNADRDVVTINAAVKPIDEVLNTTLRLLK